jgi:ABC-type uncharacterized transport system auxiliary subunit
MNILPHRHTISALILAGLLAGCGPVKTAPIQTHLIQPAHFSTQRITRTTGQHAAYGAIRLMPPTAANGYDNRAMHYMTDPQRLSRYALHAWVAPPATLFVPLLSAEFARTQQFKDIVTGPATPEVRYRLSTRLMQLQQEFLTERPILRLVMQARLTEAASHQLIAAQQFQVLIGLPNQSPETGVSATNQAFEIMAQRIAQFSLAQLANRKK